MKEEIPGHGDRRELLRAVLLRGAAVFLTVSMLWPVGCAAVQEKEIKDTISELSFSHDGKKVLFDRCREDHCQIQAYDLESSALSGYQPPPNERWTMARMSYDGKKIVFSVIPMAEEYLDVTQMQIAIMDVDGKNYRKITSSPFPKIYPVFSHSGKKVLYAKAGRIRKQGRTPASEYDAWEVDIETGKETRLTYFKFFTMRSLNYFPDDERYIFKAEVPTSFPGISLPKDNFDETMKMVDEEMRKHKLYSFAVTTMKRGDMLPQQTYTFAEDVYPRNPVLSKDGKQLFFEGKGGRYYIYSPDGNHRLVSGGASVDSAAVSPTGEYLGIIAANGGIHIYRVKDGSYRERIYVPTPRSKGFDYNGQPKYKVIPESPSLIINR